MLCRQALMTFMLLKTLDGQRSIAYLDSIEECVLDSLDIENKIVTVHIMKGLAGLMNYSRYLTLFPENDCSRAVNTSITGRAIDKKDLISLNAINIRDFAGNKHGQVDDYPYGGGAGMVMQPGPVYRSYESVDWKRLDTSQGLFILTPQGRGV